MKKTYNISIILLVAAIILIFSGCIGDKGNSLESYDVGTITTINGQECIKTDNIGIYITGANMPAFTENYIKRCFFTFFIDWDAQSENARATGIYTASINMVSTWDVKDYLTISDKPFIGSDSLNNISKPYITTVNSKHIITFQTSTFKGDNPTYNLELTNRDEVNKILTMNLIYYKGENSSKTDVDVQWQSYTLPDITENYSLIIRFKSLSQPSFNYNSYIDPVDVKANSYFCTLNYTM